MSKPQRGGPTIAPRANGTAVNLVPRPNVTSRINLVPPRWGFRGRAGLEGDGRIGTSVGRPLTGGFLDRQI